MAMNIIKKLLIAPLALLTLGSIVSGCASDTDEIDPSRTLFLARDRSRMTEVERYIEDYFAAKYNVNIRYRYEDRFASNQYKLGPTDEMKALNYVNLMRYTFFDVYDKVAPKGFTEKYTIKLLVLFGTRGFGPTQNLLGEAPNGWIQVYNINNLSIPDFEHYSSWDGFRYEYLNARDNYIQTLYHESAHTLDEEHPVPPEYAKLTLAQYKQDDAFSFWYLKNISRLHAGFISDYASKSAAEDFAELFGWYSVYQPEEWAEKMQQAASGRYPADNPLNGRQLIEKKIAIIKEYMLSEFHIDIEVIRAEAQRCMSVLTTNPKYTAADKWDAYNEYTKADFSRLPASYYSTIPATK